MRLRENFRHIVRILNCPNSYRTHISVNNFFYSVFFCGDSLFAARCDDRIGRGATKTILKTKNQTRHAHSHIETFLPDAATDSCIPLICAGNQLNVRGLIKSLTLASLPFR